MTYIKKLGKEKLKYFKENFDILDEEYKTLAKENGYQQDLVFSVEKGSVIIYAKTEEDD